jgi:endoglucanase
VKRTALVVALAALAACSPTKIDAVTAGDARVTPGKPSSDAGADARTVPSGPAYHTSGNNLVDPSGAILHVRAVTWYGLDQDFYPHGLEARTIADVLGDMKTLGFNTVRMTWSSGMLATDARVQSINYDVNPDLAGITSPLGILDRVVAEAKTQGLHVILSRRRASAGAPTKLWYDGSYSEDDFVNDWAFLAAHYVNDTTILGCDLESDLRDPATWGGTDVTTDWRRAAERAGNAVLAANPNVLVFVEGVETFDGMSYWRGGNLRGVETLPVTLTIPDRLVYATQDFPSTATDTPPLGGVPSWFTVAAYPNNLPAVWDANWGYVFERNIAPVFLMGFGTRYASDSDKAWLAALVAYVQKYDLDFAYFALNQETADVGGIYTNYPSGSENDALITALKPLLVQ